MIVEIQGLVKIYDGKEPVTAVDGIDLVVPEGGIFGLLGPNGAGKTTTISIATTRARATSGSVRIAGIDVAKSPAIARRSIGVVPQFNTLDRALTVFENLYYHCRYFGFSSREASERAEELLSQFHLTERAKAYPVQLSGGLAQRVLIARAIAHYPRVLFLDEPSAGLDPQSRIAMWDAVRSLHTQGITTVMTTHYMEEADALCGRVAIIDHGKILVEDTPDSLKNGLGAQTMFDLDLRHLDALEPLIASLRAIPNIENVEASPTGLRVFSRISNGLLPLIVNATEAYGLKDISITEPSLETVFIRLTGRDLRE